MTASCFTPDMIDRSWTDDHDEPIAQWTIDELDDSADLGTLRSAWAVADGLGD